MSYYYTQNTNYYAGDNGAKNGANSYLYVRDSQLNHIDYGFTDPNAYGNVADRIAFTPGDRCFTGSCGTQTAANWPDVPWDLSCAKGATCSNYGPAYFSTVRLASIAAEQWNGTSYNTVDNYALTEGIPTTGTYNTSTLQLDTITRTGEDTTAGGTSPPAQSESFAYEMMANRVNYTTGAGSGLGPLNRYRLTAITTESNSVISIVYELVDPVRPPASPR
ncbi:hypothetical protein GXW82_10315 [Streptacidiphilus sp. 4-A2]|nr:hypothetical protein [Streptacidiphilus sp. 4-A2]